MSADALPKRRCGAIAPDGKTCPADASTLVTIGCVHEHVKTAGMCAQHRQESVEHSGEIGCWDCHTNAVDPHDCAILVRPVRAEVTR